ncbi:MAG: hypothetical protein HWD90_09540 [Campylobacteraceae bacterium]|nr:hypothetical protein [Campylobacteraceae bacterium]
MKWKSRKPNGFNKSNILTESHDDWLRKYIKLLNTAISSWSGFVYQGKVAIYHVLLELDKSNYTLQLDSLDDFAIIDANNHIVSLHQVKAKKDTHFSSYKEDFEKLQSGGNTISCNNLFFHLAKAISDKNIEDIEADFNPIEVYKYDSIPYCEVNLIDTKIEELIISTQPRGRDNRDYASLVRKYLDNLITEKLFEIHRIIHLNLLSDEDAAFIQRIPFQDFLDILNEDLNLRTISNEYYLYQIKNDICRYYQEYCIENEPMNDELTRMNDFMLFFESLQKKDLIKFIKNIMPHRTFKFESLSDYKDNSPQQTEIKDVFIYILHQIEKKPLYLNRCLLQWKNDSKSFSPTCIIGNPRNTEKICDQIINNALSTDLDLLFENQNLITDSITVESMTASHIVRNNYQDDDKEYKHIMKWNEISLVCIDDAKGELND